MPTLLELFPITIEFFGTMLIGISILRVHSRLETEHKIDKKVIRAIRREQWLTKVGLILIAFGFLLDITII